MLWMFALAVVVVAVAGVTGEAAAQTFQGTIDFDSLPPLPMTVTLVPGGPAQYTIRIGRVTDRGFVVASVNGSSVIGFFQTTFFPNVSPCGFQGTFDGTTATLALDPFSCGGGGVITLTRA
jgi:hypothetical protein